MGLGCDFGLGTASLVASPKVLFTRKMAPKLRGLERLSSRRESKRNTANGYRALNVWFDQKRDTLGKKDLMLATLWILKGNVVDVCLGWGQLMRGSFVPRWCCELKSAIFPFPRRASY
jgi:hypothetical protein